MSHIPNNMNEFFSLLCLHTIFVSLLSSWFPYLYCHFFLSRDIQHCWYSNMPKNGIALDYVEMYESRPFVVADFFFYCMF